ncbi:MAG TPA: cytochrome o ubiquinol oxidase subunit IV [Candidatus Paceibacterota bacterium]
MRTDYHNTPHARAESAYGSIHSYIFGFLFSILCTGLAFGLVQWDLVTHHEILPHGMLILVILVLAIAQLMAQLIFFLHLGKGSQSGWNATVLAFAVLIVVIVVGGSLWIMSNLTHTSVEEMYIGGVISPSTQAD